MAEQTLPLSTRARTKLGDAGEFAFGLNEALTEFTGHTLFDEKIGGTVHLALGASYPETGGQVQSALHWDLVCDLRRGGRLLADGQPLLVDGTFR